MDMSDLEARAFLRALFPMGLRDPAVVAELCPDGWKNSPLVACYHPTPEAAYREYFERQESLRWLRGLADKRKAENDVAQTVPEEPELTFAEFVEKNSGVWGQKARQMDPTEEPAELLGMCLWDVFSNNHEVIAGDGRVVDLGSFRGTAGEIADFFEEKPDDRTDNEDAWSRLDRSDYVRFYMGTIWIRRRADLTPVYRLIFRRLKALGADWRYSFPRLHVVDLEQSAADDGLSYDPSAALSKEMEHLERRRELRRMKARLSKAARSARFAARAEPPPGIVLAYQEVFGKFPDGWPPDPYQEDEEPDPEGSP